MQIAIVGCGNMGSALAKRLSKVYSLNLYDHHPEKTEKLRLEGYGKACKDVREAVQHAKFIILAVKPQSIKEAAHSIGKNLRADQVVISLLVGISLQMLKEFFPNTQIIRMMPNLALHCGEGVIGLSFDGKISQKDREDFIKMVELLGKMHWIPEEKMNALAALTGSGPAFFFAMIEAMVDAGIAMGFTALNAQELTYQMLQGSLALLESTGKHPGELKWQITSPQGTTIAGLKTLEEWAVRGAIINTFLSAYDSANKLSLDH